jgi:3',5'-nucleoside bisphosphate phosphatase
VIDLHLHTLASDGRLRPADLVRRAADSGITILSVTDHDTVAGLPEARRTAETLGIRVVDGIEITAVHDGKDVHVLGYFIDTADRALANLLRAQRARRVERVREIGERLTRLNVPIDTDALVAAAARDEGRAIGRPALAQALVAGGHVATIQEAFDRYLATGRPAFVPRVGPTPLAVLAAIHDSRGVASMAHPGVTAQPAVLASLVDAGLDALEAHHSDHSPELRRELADFAADHGLLITGGSDFHGDDDRDRMLGGVSLPAGDFARLDAAGQSRWRS